VFFAENTFEVKVFSGENMMIGD